MSAKRHPAKKTPAETVSADNLREKAAELRKIAERIESLASKMETLEIKRIKILVGNYQLAVTGLKQWLGRQILAKLVGEAANLDRDIDIILSE